jgi:cell division protein FtsB
MSDEIAGLKKEIEQLIRTVNEHDQRIKRLQTGQGEMVVIGVFEDMVNNLNNVILRVAALEKEVKELKERGHNMP